MPVLYASTAAMSAANTAGAAYPDFSLAETTDTSRLWILSKSSAATVGANVIAANPAGRWLAAGGQTVAPWANILYVSTSGDDSTAAAGNMAKPYGTLSAALSAVTTGQTIWLGPGSYSAGGASFSIPNVEGIVIRGMGPEATTLTSSSAASVPTLTIPSTVSAVLQNITIQDMEIEKTDTSSTTNACFFADVVGAAALAGSKGLVFRNVKFTRNAPAGAGAGFYDACSLSQVNNFSLINCSGSFRAFNCGSGYAVDCNFFGQGDVFGGLISNWSNPAGGVVTAGQAKQRYVSCIIKGSTANGVTGLQIGGAPNVDFDSGCSVEDGIGLNGSLTRYSAALVPIVRFRGQWSGNLSLTYSGATNAGTFDFRQSKQISGTNTWSSSSVRQSVLFDDAALLTITPQSRIDLSLRKAKYTSFTATIGANGATVDRDVETKNVVMVAGTALYTNIFPWPTGAVVTAVGTMRTAGAPNAVGIVATANVFIGPQAALGTLTVNCGAGVDTVDVVLTRQ